jgi:hypothetical protein
MNMTEQASEALRLALNEIDRLRRRCLWMTRFLITTSFVFWCASDAMFLLRGNVAMGMVFALNTLMAAIFAVSINVGGGSYANTLKILNAIADLSREQTPKSPAE